MCREIKVSAILSWQTSSREGASGCIPVKVDIPHMLGRQRPHSLEETQLGIGSLLGGRVDVGRVRVLSLRQAGKSAGEHTQTGPGCHGCERLPGGEGKEGRRVNKGD